MYGDANEDAVEAVRATTAAILDAVVADQELLRADASRVWPIMEQYLTPRLDMRKASSKALGKRHWAGAGAAQQDRFANAFRRLILNTYASALVTNTDIAIDYLPAEPSGKDNVERVSTRIRLPGGSKITTDYWLWNDAGDWKVFDLNIEGVSLVRAYKSAFSRAAKRGGIEAVIEELEAHNAKRRTEQTQRSVSASM